MPKVKTNKRGRKKVVKKRGWPKGKKRGKRRGRPAKKVARGRVANSILLPINKQTDLDYWTDMIVFLNKYKGKSFMIQMDGVDYTLHGS